MGPLRIQGVAFSCLRKVPGSTIPGLHISAGRGRPRVGEKVGGAQQTTRTRGLKGPAVGTKGCWSLFGTATSGSRVLGLMLELLVGRQDRKCTTSQHTSPKTPPHKTL